MFFMAFYQKQKNSDFLPNNLPMMLNFNWVVFHSNCGVLYLLQFRRLHQLQRVKYQSLNGIHLESFLIKILTIFASFTLEKMNEEKWNAPASHHFQNGDSSLNEAAQH